MNDDVEEPEIRAFFWKDCEKDQLIGSSEQKIQTVTKM